MRKKSTLMPQIEGRNLSDDADAMAARLDVFKGMCPALKAETKLINQDASYNQNLGKHCDSGLIAEVSAKNFSAEQLESAIQNSGALIVRNLVPTDVCSAYRKIIDEVIASVHQEKENATKQLKKPSPFRNIASNINTVISQEDLSKSRGFQGMSGSAMCMESSALAIELLKLYEQIGLKKILKEYLRDDPCVSVKKWMLRRSVLPVNPNGWHQDGAFMGSGIDSVNMWLPLSVCGGSSGAPGLDIVPHAFTKTINSGTDGAAFNWSISESQPELNMPDKLPVSPVFNAGDALFFNHFCLHRTQYLEESFSDLRYAIETWFFSSSNYPQNQIPVAW